MKKISCFSIILLLVMCLMPLNVVADNTGGDVNNDGEVNIADVNTVIDYILGDKSHQSIDVNNDGEINIADVNAIIGIILKGTSVSEEHEYVDLGLPSGTLWATCNIGASIPEEFGDYFAWGETIPKGRYYWDNYKWINTDAAGYRGWTKYCLSIHLGYKGYHDDKTELDPEDDAATANWGLSARMPSEEQIQELVNYCNWQWILRNGVYGQLVTGPNGNTIFLPAAGARWLEQLNSVGHCGHYWSRSLFIDEIEYLPHYAMILHFTLGIVYSNEYSLRYTGYNVRAVYVSQN